MRFLKLLVITSLFIISNTAYSENKEQTGELSGGGIVYGSDIGISVSTPTGWTFDNLSGVRQGLHGVMYPDGSSWTKSSEIMYVNIVKMEPDETLEKFIQVDIDSFIINFPDLKVQIASPIIIQSGNKAESRLFTGDKWGNYEQIAYVQQKSSVVIYVFSCKTKEGFQKSHAAFKEMVANSYFVNMIF